MQDELDVHTALHEIEIDVLNEVKTLTSVSCRIEDSFEDLHYVICQRLHLHPRNIYRFYIPRIHASLREIPRSKDMFSNKKLVSVITVGDMLYYRNGSQQLRLNVRSIGMEIEKGNMERDLRRAVVALKDTVAKTTYLKKNHILRDNLTLLYGLGSDLIQKQIHKVLADQTTMVLNLKGNNLLSYCLVSATRDQVEYFFFSKQESFQRYMLVRQDAYLSSMHKEKYKDGISFVLSKKALKESDMTSPYNSQMYVEHACYVYFYDVKRGYEVDVISNHQAKELMRYLMALQKALVKMKTFNLEFANPNVAMYIGYNPHTKATLLQSGPKIAAVIADVPYGNSEVIARLQGYPRTIDVVEVDFFLCVKKPIQYQDERHVYMLEGICMGREYRKVHSETFEKDEQVHALMVDLLLDACEDNGIPQKVLVRERAAYALVADFCKQLGIQVEVYARLPKIDAFHNARIRKKAM